MNDKIMCLCPGCDNPIEGDDPFCDDCLEHMVFIKGEDGVGLYYCSLHNGPPTEEEMADVEV